MYWFYDVSPYEKYPPENCTSDFFTLGPNGAPDLCKMPWRRGKCVALSLPWRWIGGGDEQGEATGYKGMIC